MKALPKALITLFVAFGSSFFCGQSIRAQSLTVKVVDRQDKRDEYQYAAVYNNVAVGKSFSVHGAALTLALPDGRLAVVNCDYKFAEHMAGPVGNRRDCRELLVDDIEVDFHGDKAKLIWPVSIDGKKMQSETYRILGVLQRPADSLNAGPPSVTPSSASPAVASSLAGAPPSSALAALASLSVESSVAGADIEIDGSFVGSTPSTLSVAPGQHTVTVKKKGYEDWTRSMNVAGNSVHLSADLTSKPAGN